MSFVFKFWRTQVLFVGPLIPLFWTSGDVCPGFQSQGGSLFVCFLTCVILRFISGSTPANLLVTSMVTNPFRSTHLQGCPQTLVGIRTHDRLSGQQHSALNVYLPNLKNVTFLYRSNTIAWILKYFCSKLLGTGSQ